MSRATFKNEPMFPSDYLSEADLKGKEVTLTIKEVVSEELRAKDNSQSDCWIMTFEATPKKFVVKPTNADLIIKATGQEEFSELAGNRITLYPTTCFAFGDPNTPCIRVKSKTNPDKKKNKPGAAPEPEPSLSVTEQDGPQPVAASGSVPESNLKLIRDLLAKDAITPDDFNKVAMLTGTDDDEQVQILKKSGQFRAAIELMAELSRGA